MLTLSNMIPAEAKLVRLPLNIPLFGGLLFLFSALTIVSLMFLLIKLVRALYWPPLEGGAVVELLSLDKEMEEEEDVGSGRTLDV